jgi:hypothetical protein
MQPKSSTSWQPQWKPEEFKHLIPLVQDASKGRQYYSLSPREQFDIVAEIVNRFNVAASIQVDEDLAGEFSMRIVDFLKENWKWLCDDELLLATRLASVGEFGEIYKLNIKTIHQYLKAYCVLKKTIRISITIKESEMIGGTAQQVGASLMSGHALKNMPWWRKYLVSNKMLTDDEVKRRITAAQ